MKNPHLLQAAGAILLIFLVLAPPPTVVAAQAPRSTEQLKKLFTHIVAGQVIKVVKTKGVSTRERGWYDYYFSITIQVEKAEGRGLAAGARITVHAWRPVPALIPRPPSLQGHDVIPSEGDVVEVFLKRVEKSYRVLHPNGLRVVKEAPRLEKPKK